MCTTNTKETPTQKALPPQYPYVYYPALQKATGKTEKIVGLEEIAEIA